MQPVMRATSVAMSTLQSEIKTSKEIAELFYSLLSESCFLSI